MHMKQTNRQPLKLEFHNIADPIGYRSKELCGPADRIENSGDKKENRENQTPSMNSTQA